MIISIDALFGLCRKKSAGSSVHGPSSGTIIFDDQLEVNSFLESDSCTRASYSNSEVCTYTYVVLHSTLLCNYVIIPIAVKHDNAVLCIV